MANDQEALLKSYPPVSSPETYPPPTASSRKCCTGVCCAWTCLILSAILIVAGGMSYVIFNALFIPVMTNEFVVNSPDAVRYADWACKYSTSPIPPCDGEHDFVPFFEAYYPFNLTNYEDVLNGAKPMYEELGPYTYQASITKFNVSFTADGSEVSYIECWTYYWRPDRSCEGCTPEDVVIGINTGYIGAVGTAGGEPVLLVGMTGPTIDIMLKDIEQYYFNYLYSQGYTVQDILQQCQSLDSACQTLSDAALVQFSYFVKTRVPGETTSGLYGQGVSQIPQLSSIFPDAAEYGYLAITDDTIVTSEQISITAFKQLLYGPSGIVHDPLNLLDAAKLAYNDTDLLMEKYGITPRQFVSFSNYFNTTRLTYNYRLLQSRIVLEKGGGFFSARTVYEWVYDFTDPLALLLQPGDPQTAIRHNDTSFEDAASYKLGVTINTGQNNITDIANVVKWNGTETINFWEEPIPVYGNNQDGQFYFTTSNGRGEFPDRFPDFAVFSPDHARTVYLEDSGEWIYTAKGIETRRFKLSNKTYDIDPFFNQEILGFVDGSKFHSDPPFRQRFVFTAVIPLYMSQPRFFYTDPYYADQVILNKQPNPADCETIVDIEMISGNAMFAQKRLQVNFFVSNETNFSIFYPNVRTGFFYPSLWVEQSSIISDELEDEWISLLGLGLDVQKGFFIFGLVVGCVFFVISLVVVMRSRKAPAGYSAIN